MNASGEKEYHYVWSVAEPFLPQCFRLRPAQAILVVYVELLEVELRNGWLVHQRLLGEFPRQHSQKLAEASAIKTLWGLGDGVLDVFNPCAAVFDSGNGDSNDDGVTDVFNPCAAGQVGFPFICQSRNVEKDCDSQFVDNYNAQETRCHGLGFRV
ncbi:unnamed protein product [Symbiodinium sp. KB8]|nr:unnamed protein product [Symbiodinium sp. KB8]